MSKWHIVEVAWSKELYYSALTCKEEYIQEECIKSRCKFSIYYDVKLRKSSIIAKFKDEIEAMAFKLRWL